MNDLNSNSRLPEHVIAFDGVCNLCNGAVQFVINHDKAVKFRFTALQSAVGQRILQENNLPQNDFNSFIYLREQKLYQRSTAALYMLKDLGGVWSLLYGFMIFPRFIRDGVYDLIARSRYSWFGRRDSCMIPTAELRARFL